LQHLSLAIVAVLFASAVATAQPKQQPSPPPLTFLQAVAAALETSPALRPASDGLTIAQIQETQARAHYGFRFTPSARSLNGPLGLSEQSVGLELSRRLPIGTEFRLEGGMIGFGNRTGLDSGYTFGIRQPLFHAFSPAPRLELEDSARRVQGATRSVAESRQDLVLTVARAYFSIVQQQRLVAASEQALGRAEKLREASDARTKVGLATQLDLLRADLLASQAEAALSTQRESLAAASDELKVLLGKPLDAPLEIDAAAGSGALATTKIYDRSAGLETLVGLALDRRYDLREMRDRVGDARRHQTIARWNLWPDVTLDASYTDRQFSGPDAELLERLAGGWRVGLTSRYSLDRADSTAAAGVASVSVRSAEQSLRDLERRVAADVRRAVRARDRAGETAAIQLKAVDLARRQLRLAELRYERGIAGNFDVIDAESNVLQAETALIAAEIDKVLAELTLARVTGTLVPEAFIP
jgi:outer membrane protein TolC